MKSKFLLKCERSAQHQLKHQPRLSDTFLDEDVLLHENNPRDILQANRVCFMGSLERRSVANKVFPEVKNADFRVGFKTARGAHRGLSCHTEKRRHLYIYIT